jgi:hypothetical protein
MVGVKLTQAIGLQPSTWVMEAALQAANTEPEGLVLSAQVEGLGLFLS